MQRGGLDGGEWLMLCYFDATKQAGFFMLCDDAATFESFGRTNYAAVRPKARP